MADMKTSPRLSKSIGDIRSGLFARIEAVQDEYAAKGWLPARLNLNKGIARGFIELFAWGLWQLYNFLDRIHRQAIPRESTGDWLDVHAAQVDETRKPATKTRGNVLFLRGDVSGNVRIPATVPSCLQLTGPEPVSVRPCKVSSYTPSAPGASCGRNRTAPELFTAM